MTLKLTLGTDSDARKRIPIFSGCIAYFAAALAGVARHSVRGNDKHNKGQPLHHARGKSMDHSDCVPRHAMDMGDMIAYIERGGPDRENVIKLLLEEADALSWRSLAWGQELYEKYGGAPLAPAAVAAPKPIPPPVAAKHPECPRFGNYDCDSVADCVAPRAGETQVCRFGICHELVVKPREYCNKHTPVAM